jgi:hypothetical protein
LGEQAAGALDALLDGLFAGFDGGREILEGQAAGVDKVDRLAEERREPVEAGGERFEALAEGVGGTAFEAAVVGLQSFQDLRLAAQARAAGGAAMRKDKAGGDATEPGAEGQGTVVFTQPSPSHEHGLLEKVLDGRIVPQQAAQVGREHVGVLAGEDLEDLLGAGAGL